jgi:HD superfamily phosphohydrolase
VGDSNVVAAWQVSRRTAAERGLLALHRIRIQLNCTASVSSDTGDDAPDVAGDECPTLPDMSRHVHCRQGAGPMSKDLHEIRDPIHNFIRIETEERRILDSRPFQRLRHIHQLAMTYLVYPGATHKRFEHSLGVMELAGRVFDIVTKESRLYTDAAREVVPRNKLDYWRQVVCMAALCHDIGHLPFSHAAEKEVLPDGWDHERLTDDLIRGPIMADLWKGLKIDPEDVAKLALGPKKFGPKKHRHVTFSPWEAILAEIIVGDAFGVDRMDYLLRDSYHAGVAYGRFDHFRLIDTLRILPHEQTEEPTLGIEAGGLHSAEALLLARYFMYTQLYFHHIRRIYDFHLTAFLKAWLPEGHFSTDADTHLAMTDNEVNAALLATARDPRAPGHRHARAITCREHFRLVYERNPQDSRKNPKAAVAVANFLIDKYGKDSVHLFPYAETNKRTDFPVRLMDGRVVSSLDASTVLPTIPVVMAEFVFIAPEWQKEAAARLKKEIASIIEPQKEEGP